MVSCIHFGQGAGMVTGIPDRLADLTATVILAATFVIYRSHFAQVAALLMTEFPTF